MMTALTALLALVLPKAVAGIAARLVVGALLVSVPAAIYATGRSHGSAACEARHEAARQEAERKAEEAERIAQEDAARRDAWARQTEVHNDGVEQSLYDPRRCVDGEWLHNSLSRLR